jgi:hypothetical protein
MSHEKSQIRPNAKAHEELTVAASAYNEFTTALGKAIAALKFEDATADELRIVSTLQAIQSNAGIVSLTLLIFGGALKPKDGDETTTDAPETTGGVQ